MLHLPLVKLPKEIPYLIDTTDFQMIHGHKQAKRALEIAAAGGHHVLLTGPPGCGNTSIKKSIIQLQKTTELSPPIKARNSSMFLKLHN